jgi:hypothetical protein
MSEWTEAVCQELGLELSDPAAGTKLVLDLTADVAHAVARPAAPWTAFLVGLAAGRAADPEAGAAEVVAQVKRLAASWDGPATAG